MLFVWSDRKILAGAFGPVCESRRPRRDQRRTVLSIEVSLIATTVAALRGPEFPVHRRSPRPQWY